MTYFVGRQTSIETAINGYIEPSLVLAKACIGAHQDFFVGLDEAACCVGAELWRQRVLNMNLNLDVCLQVLGIKKVHRIFCASTCIGGILRKRSDNFHATGFAYRLRQAGECRHRKCDQEERDGPCAMP